jgi:hypothetical protein
LSGEVARVRGCVEPSLPQTHENVVSAAHCKRGVRGEVERSGAVPSALLAFLAVLAARRHLCVCRGSVQRDHGLPAERLHLVYGGQRMEDTRPIGSYNTAMGSGACVFLREPTIPYRVSVTAVAVDVRGDAVQPSTSSSCAHLHQLCRLRLSVPRRQQTSAALLLVQALALAPVLVPATLLRSACPQAPFN